MADMTVRTAPACQPTVTAANPFAVGVNGLVAVSAEGGSGSSGSGFSAVRTRPITAVRAAAASVPAPVSSVPVPVASVSAPAVPVPGVPTTEMLDAQEKAAQAAAVRLSAQIEAGRTAAQAAAYAAAAAAQANVRRTSAPQTMAQAAARAAAQAAARTAAQAAMEANSRRILASQAAAQANAQANALSQAYRQAAERAAQAAASASVSPSSSVTASASVTASPSVAESASVAASTSVVEPKMAVNSAPVTQPPWLDLGKAYGIRGDWAIGVSCKDQPVGCVSMVWVNSLILTARSQYFRQLYSQSQSRTFADVGRVVATSEISVNTMWTVHACLRYLYSTGQELPPYQYTFYQLLQMGNLAAKWQLDSMLTLIQAKVLEAFANMDVATAAMWMSRVEGYGGNGQLAATLRQAFQARIAEAPPASSSAATSATNATVAATVGTSTSSTAAIDDSQLQTLTDVAVGRRSRQDDASDAGDVDSSKRLRQ